MKRIALFVVAAALLGLGSAAFAADSCTCSASKSQNDAQHSSKWDDENWRLRHQGP